MSKVVIDNQPMTQSLASEPQYLHRKNCYSFQFIYTGSPNGTIYISVSNNGITWEVLTAYSVAINSAGTQMMNVVGAGYSMCKAHFAFISGSGFLTVDHDSKDSA